MMINDDIKLKLKNSSVIPRDIALAAIPESGRRKFLEFKGRQSCIQKAMSKPLPGNLADAFIKGAIKVDGVTVHEVVPIHIKCLQAVDSPILKLVEKATAKAGESQNQDFDENQEWELCYIFTENPKTLRKLLKESGVEGLKKLAEETIDGNWNSAKINAVIMSVLEQFYRHVKTTVKFTAEIEAQGDVSFFRELRDESLSRKESAGSSPTSASIENTTLPKA